MSTCEKEFEEERERLNFNPKPKRTPIHASTCFFPSFLCMFSLVFSLTYPHVENTYIQVYFYSIFSFHKTFFLLQIIILNGVSVRIKLIIFSSVLMLMGVYFYVYGDSIERNFFNSEGLISGMYIGIFGVFLILAGFLVLASQVFRGSSVLY